MPSTTFNLPAQNTTDAEFRAWVQAIHDALTAAGLVQTADTGQINLGTVLKPTTFYTVMGYEIWRFNDTLQATYPVFIKIEYGSGNSSANTQGLWITVGTGTNGAGTLTGQVSSRMQGGAGSPVSTAGLSRVSASTNRLMLAMNCAGAGIAQCMIWNIERTKDSTGADNSEGIYICHMNNSTSGVASPIGWQVIPFSGTIPAKDTSNPVAVPATATAAQGADIGVFAHEPFLGKQLNPMLGVLTYKTADITVGTFIPITLYGTARQYLVLGSGTTMTAAGNTNLRGSTDCSVAIRAD